VSHDPVFVHGILPRSGTNFLWDLLLLHPDCARARVPVNEDLFLDHADGLVQFVDSVRDAWDPNWGVYPDGISGELRAALGHGLITFLQTDPARRLVTKSPSVRHLEWFFTFFPHARLLLLVRDGRAVAQSAMGTFGWDLDRAARAWAEAARTIQQFQVAESARAHRWRIVRYEDLVDDTERALREIFDFLELDPALYDFAAARNLPVRGSSAFGRRDGKVHWDSVAKDAQFEPKERWKNWTAAQVDRFDWLAGEQLVGFGYSTARPRTSLARTTVHTTRDWLWQSWRYARLLTYRLRGRLAIRTRIARLLKSPGGA
jgi:protein-tyrosine sulfotransferase